jgi:hypothetical protein
MFEAVFPMRSASRLHNESIMRCELVRQLEAREFGSKASRELTTEVGGWQLDVSPACELTAEGITHGSQRSEYEFGVRRSPPSKDASPEAEERSPLEAVTKQRDWEHLSSGCDSDLAWVYNKSSY